MENKPKPTWTKTRPTTPGWYWYKDDKMDPLVVLHVEPGVADFLWALNVGPAFGETEGDCQVADLSGWWQGPIAPVGGPGGE